jgi:uncharacterized DUF497 family protein
MRFLVDECTGPAVAGWLRQQNHDVFSVYEQARGMEDDRIIQKAFDEGLCEIRIISARKATNREAKQYRESSI